MLLCLTEDGPGRLVTAGSRSGAENSLHWTLAWKSKLVFNQQGERETKTDPRFTLYISRMMRTQNPVHVRRVRQIYAENFIRQVTRQLQEKITVCSLLTFLPLHTSHPFLSNTTFSPKDFLIKHLKQFYCDHVMKPCGLKLGHNVPSG